MALNTDLASYESTWKRDCDFRESSSRRRESRDMQDWQDSDVVPYPAFVPTSSHSVNPELDEARKEGAELNQWPVCCDGSGIVDEFYIDVDQTQVIECKGCPACDAELVEFRGGRRKGVSSEVATPASRRTA